MCNDLLHKLTHRIANAYDVVIVEDLNMQDMSQALKFVKSVADNGWGIFRQFLSYKLTERGKQLIKINKWFASSQMCSKYGTKHNNLQLADRIYCCINENCNLEICRDYNAAINIRTTRLLVEFNCRSKLTTKLS